MEVALGSATSLLGKVWTTLSDSLVAAYVDILQLGHNSEQIRDKLLHNAQAQGSHVHDNPGLQGLLKKLSRDADNNHQHITLPSPRSPTLLASSARHMSRRPPESTASSCAVCCFHHCSREAAGGVQMAAALGPAATLLGKVFTMLSAVPVAAYVDSLKLGHNSEQIKDKLAHTRGLLHNAQAQGSHVGHNPGLQRLLEKLSRDADQAEDLLDEVHYFQIHDKLHGTNYATTQDLDGRQALHAGSALHHLFRCFSCSPTPNSKRMNGGDAAAAAVAGAPRRVTNTLLRCLSCSCTPKRKYGDTPHFDRVSISSKIKSLLQDMESHCDSVYNLLNTIPSSSTAVAVVLQRPQTASMIS